MRSAHTALTSTLREAVRSLHRANLRTLLGLIGIMIGIASVITMISTGEIAKAQSRKDFEALGTDILTIRTPEHPSGRRRSRVHRARRRARAGRGAALGLRSGAENPDAGLVPLRGQAGRQRAGPGSVGLVRAPEQARDGRGAVSSRTWIRDATSSSSAPAWRRPCTGAAPASAVGEVLEVGERLCTPSWARWSPRRRPSRCRSRWKPTAPCSCPSPPRGESSPRGGSS